MRSFTFTLILLAFTVCDNLLIAQGVFESNTSNGRWNVSGSWTLVSGSDSDGVPDSNDDVTILSGDLIEVRRDEECDDLTIVGTLDFGLNRDLTVNGDFSATGASAQITGGNNKVITVSGAFSVSAAADLEVDISDITVSGSTTISGDIDFTQSHDHSFQSITIASTGSWTNSTISDFTIGGNLTNNGSFSGCTNLTACQYIMTSSSGSISGTSSISVPDFVINSPASYTNTGTVTVTDNITGTGTFINGTNASFTLDESAEADISNFTATATGNTVTYSVDLIRDLLSTTSNTFYNLVINNVGPLDHVDLTTNTRVTNQLTVTTGNLRLGNNTLIMSSGATISGGSTNGYIEIDGTGVVRQEYSSAGTTLSFPIGENTDYTPITAFTINSATFGAGAYLEFDITDANHPNRNTNNTGSGGDDDGTAAVAFISRYWTVTSNNITSPRYDASYTYLTGDITGTEANMVGTIYRTPPGQAFQDWHVGGTVNVTNNTVSVSNVDAFGDLYAMDNTSDRLPIVLISFEAKSASTGVELKWTTASEENNDFYTIERSKDGDVFIPVLTIAGAGNSNELLTYSAFDDNPLEGQSFYRLKQTDFNGQFEYSEIRSVLFEKEINPAFKIYPNPVVRGQVITVELSQLNYNEIIKAYIFNTAGDRFQVNQIRNELARPVQFEIPPNLDEGVYILRVSINGYQTQKKLLIR